MKTQLFNYNLPEELIAQEPPKIRGNARLLVIDRQKREFKHKKYSDISHYLSPGDCTVLNNTRVYKARIFGYIKRNGKKVECLGIKPLGTRKWEFIITRAKSVKLGDEIIISDCCSLNVLSKIEETPLFVVEFIGELPAETFDEYGHTPLPPYISRNDRDSDYNRYNTVFSREIGSAASPTASLNLTKEQLGSFETKGVDIAYVTLHVGWGTFAPVRTEDIEDFKIHSEKYSINSDAINRINRAKQNGHKVVAFGTTATRVLETVYSKSPVLPQSGETSLFICPGYEWKCIDALVTNFHAPNTSLLMLVAAFVGYDLMIEAYQEALRKRYSFLSYGDSMLIV
ncbi:tRNA preQ1(34) S-adenosylmethionine ribosyltransferase-isomerase QueA [Candidatus Nomurabacteria bacterium]|nr:tRNA preQ1(34) S-adenosylmethionine ribosyltransferase-isomerase QueA [Candidatus Nomurabacteria bacterium]